MSYCYSNYCYSSAIIAKSACHMPHRYHSRWLQVCWARVVIGTLHGLIIGQLAQLAGQLLLSSCFCQLWLASIFRGCLSCQMAKTSLTSKWAVVRTRLGTHRKSWWMCSASLRVCKPPTKNLSQSLGLQFARLHFPAALWWPWMLRQNGGRIFFGGGIALGHVAVNMMSFSMELLRLLILMSTSVQGRMFWFRISCFRFKMKAYKTFCVPVISFEL